MILTASTVKDTLPGVRRFVAGNLANGVDHLVVFLDAPRAEGQGEVAEFLEGHEHVTCIRTDKTWWLGERPAQLNDRQRINANVVKVALTAFDWAEWVFHIDADEIALIDRAVLAQVPPEQRAVRLSPLEAVSQRDWDGDPTHFKRLLGKGDLTLLQTLGVIDRPSNGAYFHGHVDGKVGLRPCLDHWLALHQVVDGRGEKIEAYADDALRMLHYESWSGEDFVRKWTGILAAGPMANFRPAREPTAIALQTLIRKDLSAEQARPYLMRIFERTTLDDLDTLRDLGLLEEVDPRGGGHTPQHFPAGGREAFETLLGALAAEPKQPFHPGAGVDAVAAMLQRAGVTPDRDAAGVRGARRLWGRS